MNSWFFGSPLVNVILSFLESQDVQAGNTLNDHLVQPLSCICQGARSGETQTW